MWGFHKNCPECQPKAGKAECGRFSRLWRPRYMIYVYVITSKLKKFRYVGITNNPIRRVKEHNHGKNKSTASYAPFDLKLKETYDSYIEAREREIFLKSGQGRKFLDTL